MERFPSMNEQRGLEGRGIIRVGVRGSEITWGAVAGQYQPSTGEELEICYDGDALNYIS